MALFLLAVLAGLIRADYLRWRRSTDFAAMRFHAEQDAPFVAPLGKVAGRAMVRMEGGER